MGTQKHPAPPPQQTATAVGFVLLAVFVGRPQAQAPAPSPAESSQPRTDPLEAASLNSIFRRWGVAPPNSTWNITGDPCSGTAVDSTDFNRPGLNPSLKCTCDETTCHITQLKVYDRSVVGEIPDELKNLKFLFDLNLAQNYLTGPLPAFIGNLTAMKWLSVGLNALSGPFPKELGNLQQLLTLGMGGNNFSGTLPLELGNMTSLEECYIDSCGLSGDIPLSFYKLKKLRIFWASDNNFTGRIPDFIGTWTNLTDLDLSYNELSGSFPSWVDDENLHLNLVFNNFVVDDSNTSALPSRLNCLQRDIQCNRFLPIYYSFGIKCGGSRSITTSDGTIYEVDDKNLSTASYYVTDAKKWAVSSIGRFMDNPSPNYGWSILNQFTNTLDPELFQTARLSPSSLRYYGLGLQNGNYIVKLHFAEIAYPDSPLSWKTAGRRIFDIYIQGRLMEKDFNIREKAGGSYKAVVRNYTAPVTNNFLEIHLFWAGRGTCCTPNQGYYGPAISAISVAPFDFKPTVSNQPPSTSSTKKNRGLIVGVMVGVGVTALCVLFGLGIFIRKAKRKRLCLDDDQELGGLSLSANMFSYAELKTATEDFNHNNKDFNHNNKLGEGGFGSVFKGTLSDGRVVAVKQLSVSSHQGKRQFVTEINTISAVQHRNLVKLYGCCVEGDKRLLIYEYLENKSLDQALFGEKKLWLDWCTRFEICLGSARALAYLHEESRIRIIHRDVKASNILLDSDLNPKISDFGLAKLYDDKKTHISTRVAGTIGYLAPEYAMRGHLTEKADVFGFGVVALEIISGRPNSDASLPREKIYLLEWAWQLHENKCELEMVDPALTKYNMEQALRVIGVGLLCTQSSPMLRPPMSRVVAMLVGDMEVSNVTSRPAYLTDWQFNDLSTTFASTSNLEEASPTLTGSSNVNMSSNVSSMLGSSPSPAPYDRSLEDNADELSLFHHSSM